MSHQCSCGRDLNNNYVSYTSAYANANSSIDREANGNGVAKTTAAKRAAMMGNNNNNNSTTSTMSGAQTQLTAKVMFGTVGAIKELREKEKSRHGGATRASDRRN